VYRESDDLVWMSAHLFVKASVYSRASDMIALDVIEPFVTRCRERRATQGHFFIRYHERGPHLRLRLCVARSAARSVAESLVEHVHALAPRADVQSWRPEWAPEGSCYYEELVERNCAPIALLGEQATSPVNEELVSLRWIPYEPEIERYGGPDAIDIAHRIFEASSNVALDLLHGLATASRSVRLGRALLLSLATINIYAEDRKGASQFAQMYGTGYLRSVAGDTQAHDAMLHAFQEGFALQADILSGQIEELWRALSEDVHFSLLGSYPLALRRERDRLRQLNHAGQVTTSGRPIGDWATCVRRIVPSYLHMSNNRIGVSIAEEAYLAHLIHWTLATR